MTCKLWFGVAAITASMASPKAAFASETTTYTYDAQGRVVAVSHSGGVNNGVQTTYTYDAADNRTNATTTGSSNGAPGGDGASVTSYRTRYIFNGRFFVSILRD